MTQDERRANWRKWKRQQRARSEKPMTSHNTHNGTCPGCGAQIDTRSKMCRACNCAKVAAERSPSPLASFGKIDLTPGMLRVIRKAYAAADEIGRAEIAARNMDVEFE